MSVFFKSDCLIIDDHPITAMGVKSMIESNFNFTNVHIVNDHRDVLKTLRNNEIILIILDINLGNVNGIDVFRIIKGHDFQGKIVFLSACSDMVHVEMTRQIGANGYLCKREELKVHIQNIRHVLNGYNCFPIHGSKFPILKYKEILTLSYMIEGKSKNEIVNNLDINPKSINRLEKNILKKFGMDSVGEVVRMHNIN